MREMHVIAAEPSSIKVKVKYLGSSKLAAKTSTVIKVAPKK